MLAATTPMLSAEADSDSTSFADKELDVVTVTAHNEIRQMREGAIPVAVLGKRQLEGTTSSINDALSRMAGITIRNTGGVGSASRIDVSTLRNDGVSAYPGALYIRDGILYVGLEQYSSNWMPVEVSLEMALIDVTTDTIIKKIRNTSLGICGATRPVDAQSIFEDENGDIYVNCMGSFGYIPGLNAGIARIKKGETDFDETYCIDFTKTKVSGLDCEYIMCNFMCRYTSGGKMFGYAYSPALDPTNTNTYLVSQRCFCRSWLICTTRQLRCSTGSRHPTATASPWAGTVTRWSMARPTVSTTASAPLTSTPAKSRPRLQPSPASPRSSTALNEYPLTPIL